MLAYLKNIIILQYNLFIIEDFVMAKSIERLYDMEDLAMLERGQIFHNAFLIDDPDFVAAFPHLAPPFAPNMQTAIDTADALPSGAEIDAEIAVVTEELNAIMPLGQRAMQILFTYVALAWNSNAKSNLFGKSKYEKARNSVLKMKELLELANRQAEVPANKTALIAVGYTQIAITELKTISDDLDAKNQEQVDMMAARGQKTETRIIALNAVWSFMMQINKASKVVFVDNPAKIELYLLYPTQYSSLGKVQGLTGILEGLPSLHVKLNWLFVTGGIDYEIERSAVPVGQPIGPLIPLATIQNNDYTDIIGGSQSLYYRVRARNGSLTGAWSDVVQVDS